jgi:hypothetical protein
VVGFPSWYIDVAVSSFADDIAGFRPPFRPRALAAANPSMVRDLIISLSNSANAAIMIKNNLPSGVEVLMFCSSTSRLTPFSFRSMTEFNWPLDSDSN